MAVVVLKKKKDTTSEIRNKWGIILKLESVMERIGFKWFRLHFNSGLLWTW